MAWGLLLRLPDFPTSRLPRLIDVLERRVDRRFYLSAKAASKLRINENWYSQFVNVERERERERARYGVLMNRCRIHKSTDCATTLMARDYKGFGNQFMTGVLEWEL